MDDDKPLRSRPVTWLFDAVARLARVGVGPELSRSDARDVTVANGVVIAGELMVLALGVKNCLIGHPAHTRLGLIEFAAALVLPLSLLFNHKRRYLLAPTWALGWVMGVNVAGTFIVGRDAGVQLTLPVFVFIPYLIYMRRYNGVAVAAAIIATVVTGLTFALMPTAPVIGPPLDPQRAGAVVTTAAITLCVILGVLSLLSRLATQSAEEFAEQEQERADHLLLNVLPASIAEQLKRSTQTIAERASDVTVLFADIVGFTPLSQSIPPEEVLWILDRVFSAFDVLTEKHGLEKIKTIGDAYMVAGGVPEACTGHAEAVAAMALEMLEVVRGLDLSGHGPLQLRIGLHTGPVVAGVIGQRKFSYDLWGDTVNTASRLESHGTAGRVHVAASTRERLAHRFEFELRGTIVVKGKGEMETYYLIGPKEPRAS